MKAGVKELLVISQDTSAYGLDLKYAESPWKGGRSRPVLRPHARRWASSAPGCACTTSIPIRMSMTCIPLMAEGKILPYLDIPFQHASPSVLKAMRRPARTGEDARAHPPLARDLSRPRHPLDLHRRLPRRDGGGLPVPARLAAGGRARPRRLLPLRARRRRPGQRPRRRRPRRGEGGALAPLHGGPEGGQRRADCAQRSAATSTSSSTRSTRKAPSAARSGTRRRSTAAYSSTAQPFAARRDRSGPRRPCRRIRPLGRAYRLLSIKKGGLEWPPLECLACACHKTWKRLSRMMIDKGTPSTHSATLFIAVLLEG